MENRSIDCIRYKDFGVETLEGGRFPLTRQFRILISTEAIELLMASRHMHIETRVYIGELLSRVSRVLRINSNQPARCECIMCADARAVCRTRVVI